MKIEYENDNVKKSLEQFALAEIKTTLNKIEKKLKGFNPKKPSNNFRYLKEWKLWRLRIGDFRIFFSYQNEFIKVYYFGDRKEVYQKYKRKIK